MNVPTQNQPFELTQPTYLSGNWARFLSQADDRLRYVRVIGGVASLTDKFMLIRHDLGGAVPDGFYWVDRKLMIPAKPPMSFGGARYSYPNHEYPDVECFNPNFATLSELGRIERGSIETMMGVADRIRRTDGDVTMTPTGIHLRQYNAKDMSCLQSFGFTPDDLEIYVKGDHFYMAMTELLRYDYSYFMIRRIDESSICLVFGHNWNNCVLVSPMGMNRSHQDGQHLR